MSKGIFETVAGAAAIATGAILIATGVGAAVAPFLIQAGAGLVMTPIGTMAYVAPQDGDAI